MEAFIINKFEDLKIQLEDVISATNNFHKNNFIGGGGFGKVYKGKLSRFMKQSTVAFKRLDRQYGQGEPEFLKEIAMLSLYRHENLISLLGFCIEGDEMILAYEHASNGSLDSHLDSPSLTWTCRLKICLQAAKGVRYLHDPKGMHQRLIHRDIKSANILLDDEWNAKVSDFGLSKVSPVNEHNSYIVSSITGTNGYCDPEYLKTYTLTEKSDVYSFGVMLFEVLCGRLCYHCIASDQVQIFVRMWIESYKQNKIEEIIFKGLKKEKMDRSSLKVFSDIAYQCLSEYRKERPTMDKVVKEIEIALQMQERHDLILKPLLSMEYEEIVRVVVPPLSYSSIEELQVLLSEGVLINGGKAWLSLNDKGEHHVMISIEDCLSLEYPNRYRYSSEEKSRFAVGCYKTRFMEFKLLVTTPLLLSPDVPYGLNLVFHCMEIENMKQHVGIRYKLQGEKRISIVHFADKKENKWLVVELYQFTSNEESILDLEIFLEDCGLSGNFCIEGIEFRPLEKVERQVVIANQEIVRGAVPPLSYRFTEESEVLLSQGILFNGGKTWLSINNKRELCVLISIEDCLIRDERNGNDSDKFSLDKDSRFAVGCYKAYSMNFKIRVRTPFTLSPHVTYGINLIFQYINIEQMKQQSLPVRYKLQGETKISIVHYADAREDEWLVAELYQFTSDEDNSILDIEIVFESCGLSDCFYIEGIEFQPLEKVEHALVAVGYEDVHKASVTPLFYTSTEELKLLLTRGILLNGCKTWLSITEKGEHIERIYIEACLNPAEIKANRLKHSCGDIVNSRFPGGLCYEYRWDGFIARVRGQHLTPQISYMVNLVFRYNYEWDVNSCNPLRYKIDGEKDETKVFRIYPIDMRQDGWFIAPLYHFTSQHKTADLQFEFEFRSTCLLVAGIEFHPSAEKVDVEFQEYQDIVEAASQSLFYTSLDELKQILSKGVHLNGYKTWFSLNKKGEHCKMISIKDCLIPNVAFFSRYESHCWSRFPAGFYQTNNKEFKTRMKTQFLSPSITYTVNLVFYIPSLSYQHYVDLKYRLTWETTTSTVYLANRRDDDLCYMAELYQFTIDDDGSIVDLEIIFEGFGIDIDGVEGIMFQPLEIVEDQVSKDDKVENIQTIPDSESDTYWEQKFPNDYEEMLTLSKDSLTWTTKKELYSILRRGFLINNGQEWFTVDKHGKKCLMLSARATWVIDDKNSTCESSHESRFGEVLVITAGNKFRIKIKIESKVVSPETTYAVYLVYKLPQDQSRFKAPLEVDFGSFAYLVSPPDTPVIGSKLDENTHTTVNRSNKLKVVPQQRSDGWMEVKVQEFQTQTTIETIFIAFMLRHPGNKELRGLMVQGIELRPI